MNKKKQIEEMRKIMCEEYGEMCNECILGGDCVNEFISERLHNAGYRNCKDKIVIDKEDFYKNYILIDELLIAKDLTEHFVNVASAQERKIKLLQDKLYHTRKETAREFVNFVAEHCDNESLVWLLDEFIAKEYGVEVDDEKI